MEEATGPTLGEELQQHSLYEHIGVTGADMHFMVCEATTTLLY